MKNNRLLILLATAGILYSCQTVQAQHPVYHYTPPPPTYHYQPFYNFGKYGTVSQKHHFTVVFADGKDTTAYTKIIADSPAHYLLLENKAVSKKDSGRHIKIYPSQTKYISHLDVTTGKEFVGQANDSCWLFKVVTGKMNAYTDMGEISVDDNFIRYLQVGDGPMISVTDPKAADLFASNEKAQAAFADKKYNKAISRYNK